jgi:hypothetical protein
MKDELEVNEIYPSAQLIKHWVMRTNGGMDVHTNVLLTSVLTGNCQFHAPDALPAQWSSIE